MWRRQGAILGVLVLVAAAVNVPLAVGFIHSRTAPWSPPVVHDTGSAAAARGWPHPTPHDEPWPAPDYWTVSKEFGARRYHVAARSAADPQRNGHSMEYEMYGWPLPVLHRVQMWWPWDDPAWKSAEESDPAMGLWWPGVVGNPLLLGLGVWLATCGPWVLFTLARRACRRCRSQCIYCGYPIGVSELCTECGRPFAA